MKIEIEKSPYGDTGKIYQGILGMTQHFILQLKSFRMQNKTPEERAHLEADIHGYEEILKANSEENAQKFMETKHEARLNGRPFENNEAVIVHMKGNGLWKEGEANDLSR